MILFHKHFEIDINARIQMSFMRNFYLFRNITKIYTCMSLFSI